MKKNLTHIYIKGLYAIFSGLVVLVVVYDGSVNNLAYYWADFIMQACPCDEDPLTPDFYIVKLGFIRVFIFP